MRTRLLLPLLLLPAVVGLNAVDGARPEPADSATYSRFQLYRAIQQRLERYFDFEDARALREAEEMATALTEEFADSFYLRQCSRYRIWRSSQNPERPLLKQRFQELSALLGAATADTVVAGRFAALGDDFERLGDTAAAVICRQHGGDLYSRLGSFDAAARQLDRALRSARALGDWDGTGRTFNLVGSHLERTGKYLAAGEYFDSARVIRMQIGDRRGVAETLGNISAIYLVFDDRERAYQFAAEALRLRREANDGAATLQTLFNIIPTFAGVQPLDTMSRLLAEAESLAAANPQMATAGRLDYCRAAMLRAGGATDSALLLLKQAAADPAIQSDRRLQLLVLQDLASLDVAVGDYRAALQTYLRAQALAESLRQRPASATIAHNLGALQQRLGDLEGAEESYRQALTLRRQLQMGGQSLGTLVNLADIYTTAGDFATAAEYLQQAAIAAGVARDQDDRDLVFLALARLGSARGETEEAMGWIDSALVGDDGSGTQRRFDLLCLKAEVARQGRRLSGAKQYQEQAQQMPISGATRINAQKIALLKALCAFDAGEWADARGELAQLVAEIEHTRSALPDLQLRSVYQAQSRFVYEKLIATDYELYRRSGDGGWVDSMLLYSEKAKSRSLLDALEAPSAPGDRYSAREGRLLATLDSLETVLGRDATASPSNSARRQAEQVESELRRLRLARAGIVNPAAYELQSLAVDEIRRGLSDEHAAVFSYLLAPERSFLVIIDRSGATVTVLPGRAEITRAVARFSRVIQQSISEETLLDSVSLAAEYLGEMVLPVRLLQDRRYQHLFISADAALSLVPFEALRVSGDYLIAACDLVMVPSLHLLQMSSGAASGRKGRLLAIADPRRGAAMRQLPYADDEVAWIAEALGRERVSSLAGAAATRAALGRQDLGSFDYLHFATHSSIHYDDPLRSKIWLSQDTLEGGGDYLTIADIRKLKLHANLVVLSSCESGGGEFELGEGMNGFVRAFFEAGARNLIVSLWEVEDFATATLMRAFYRHLDIGYAAALRAAKLEMLSSPRRKHRHPFYWSPFVLTSSGAAN